MVDGIVRVPFVYYRKVFLVLRALKIHLPFHLKGQNLPAAQGALTHQPKRTLDENVLVGFDFLFFLLRYSYLYNLMTSS